MAEITFTVPGVPVPKGRPRFVPGHCYTPQKTLSYEAELKYWFLKSIGNLFKPLDCPIRLTVMAYFPMPKSATIKDRSNCVRPKTTKPDLDNVIKSICDGLNKIAWFDDSRIHSIEASKKETVNQPFCSIKIEW